jgi:hypothetical protein
MFSRFIQSLWFQVLHIVIIHVFNLYYYSYNYYFNTFQNLSINVFFHVHVISKTKK